MNNPAPTLLMWSNARRVASSSGQPPPPLPPPPPPPSSVTMSIGSERMALISLSLSRSAAETAEFELEEAGEDELAA